MHPGHHRSHSAGNFASTKGLLNLKSKNVPPGLELLHQYIGKKSYTWYKASVSASPSMSMASCNFSP